MDVVTLALAKQYTNSQRLAYVEDNSITWNGDITGKTVIDIEESKFVRISSEPANFEKVTGVKAILMGVGGTPETQEQPFTVVVGEGLTIIQDPDNAGPPYAMSVEDDLVDGDFSWPRGTYLWYYEILNSSGKLLGVSYTSLIAMEETIHQIDPKFIPGAVLPVVKLETVIQIGGLDSDVTTALTAEESAQLKAAVDAGTPCIIRFDVEYDGESVGQYTALFSLGGASNVQSFFAKLDTLRVLFGTEDGTTFNAIAGTRAF